MFLKQCDCHCEILLRERVEKFSKLLFAEFCELFALAAGFPLVFANLWYLGWEGPGVPILYFGIHWYTIQLGNLTRLGRPRGAGWGQ